MAMTHRGRDACEAEEGCKWGTERHRWRPEGVQSSWAVEEDGKRMLWLSVVQSKS